VHFDDQIGSSFEEFYSSKVEQVKVVFNVQNLAFCFVSTCDNKMRTDVEVICSSDNGATTPEDFAFTKLTQYVRSYKVFKRMFIPDPVALQYYSLDYTRTVLTSTRDTFTNGIVYHMFFESDFSTITDIISYDCTITGHTNNHAAWAGFGAGLMDVINSKAPKWDYNDKDHGCYIMSSDKWVCINRHPDNATLKGFSFGLNDLVRLTYNAKTKDLLLEKNPGKETVFMIIPNVPSHARPCVLLLHEGVTVTIR
jgi:hypothetical protein